ncbi:MAG TPA: hypothetical protein VEK57_18860 [Thermoanaerobaculia bacterium]|nr:hypothetical protein [Thermoanaerobaculia bacterium]
MNSGLFETIFWIFFGGIVLWIAGTAVWMAMRWNAPLPSQPSRGKPAKKEPSGGGLGGETATYGIASASMSESVSFADSSSSNDLSTDTGGDTGSDTGSDSGGDTGSGDFSGGGGDSGGGGSSGGW